MEESLAEWLIVICDRGTGGCADNMLGYYEKRLKFLKVDLVAW